MEQMRKLMQEQKAKKAEAAQQSQLQKAVTNEPQQQYQNSLKSQLN